MIEILKRHELEFINFLNANKFTNKKVKLSILHNYETVGNGGVGFAVYLPKYKTIMLPTKRPKEVKDYKDFIIHNLAHEYKHFLQDINHKEFNEEEADKFSDKMCEEFTRRRNK